MRPLAINTMNIRPAVMAMGIGKAGSFAPIVGTLPGGK